MHDVRWSLFYQSINVNKPDLLALILNMDSTFFVLSYLVFTSSVPLLLISLYSIFFFNFSEL